MICSKWELVERRSLVLPPHPAGVDGGGSGGMERLYFLIVGGLYSLYSLGLTSLLGRLGARGRLERLDIPNRGLGLRVWD